MNTHKPFYFKQFQLEHHRSPMKITTDSILLGAWAPIPNKLNSILEIGTGCGVIAMMLSQRLNHQVDIDAVDICPSAIEECQWNVKKANFTRITPICLEIQRLVDKKYDLIVTNPPYFEVSLECKTKQRTSARQTTDLTFEQLILSVDKHLTKEGFFCLVLPEKMMLIFDELIQKSGFTINHQLMIQHQFDKPISLVLACYVRPNSNKKLIQQPLILREQNGNYTIAAKKLLADFYLKM